MTHRMSAAIFKLISAVCLCVWMKNIVEKLSSERQAAVGLSLRVEQFLGHCAGDLPTEQVQSLESLKDEVQHKFTTVSRTAFFTSHL